MALSSQAAASSPGGPRTTPPRLALTGVTGAIGGAVAALADPRAVLLARDPSRVPGDLPGEVRRAAYDQGAAETLEGIDVLLLVSATEAPQRRDQHRAMVDAAARAGVGHVVYTSFAGAAPDAQQWQLDAWVSTYTAIADGSMSRVSDDVPNVPGRPALTLEECLRQG